MKNLIKIYFFIICFFCSLNVLHAQWVKTSFPTNNNNSLGITSFAISGTNIFVGTNASGIFLSTDNGASWDTVNSGLESHMVNCIVVKGTNLFAGCWNDDYPRPITCGLYLSTNNGLSWSADTVGLSNNSVTTLATYGGNIIAGTPWNPFSRQQGGVYLSTNNGADWKNISTEWPPMDSASIITVEKVAILPNGEGSSNLFASCWNAGMGAYPVTWVSNLYMSSNDGTSWTTVNSGLTNSLVEDFEMSGNSIFVGTLWFDTKPGGIYLNTNNGSSWTKVNSDLPKDSSFSVWSFATSPSESGDTNIFAGTNNGVYLSSNNGTNWTSISSGLPSNVPIFALAIIINGEGDTSLFAGTSRGVWMHPFSKKFPIIELNKYTIEFYSSDTNVEKDSIRVTNNSHVPLVVDSVYTKTKWFAVTLLHDTVTDADTVSLSVSFSPDSVRTYSDTLYIVSNSVYKLTKVPLSGQMSVTSIWQNKPINPKQFEISQNYPNPFNPTTTINYSVAKNTLVSIKIYDILGRKIETLVNKQEIPGNYNIEFNASKLASGIYFYRMQAGDFVETKKLILLK